MIAARSWVMQEMKGRILFIDDDQDTCEMISLLLGQAGYEATIASSVTEGLSKARSDRFDLILLDWYFPDGTGLDLCKMIRSYDSKIPIFFYTGIAFDAYIHKAMQAGAQGCFIKPVDVENLLQTISRYSKNENGIRKLNRRM